MDQVRRNSVLLGAWLAFLMQFAGVVWLVSNMRSDVDNLLDWVNMNRNVESRLAVIESKLEDIVEELRRERRQRAAAAHSASAVQERYPFSRRTSNPGINEVR